MAVTIPVGFHALPVPIVQLSLAAVLKCGQSFRWSIYPLPQASIPSSELPTHEYRLCLRDRIICLRQSTDSLFYRSMFPDQHVCSTQATLREAETLSWLKDYFQLDIDLVKLYDEWSERDNVFKNLRSRFSGIRILRQDPWENLVSFICSSNNNIARITKMVHALCRHYSPPLLSLRPPMTEGASADSDPITYHPFPPPSALASSEVAATLRGLGFGYRADFIQRTARMLVDMPDSQPITGQQHAAERWLLLLRNKPTAIAREELLKFVGVGRKVADCILLMSLDKKEVVPIDTHVYQIAVKHYGLHVVTKSKTKATMTPKLYEEVSGKLFDIWGDYAGWAHSVLFTADLKSFSAYGLPSTTAEGDGIDHALSTPTMSSSSSPSKRKRRGTLHSPKELAGIVVDIDTVSHVIDESNDETNMADRIKRRRRTVTKA
ncbi:DNA glycosylase [Hygrophoropsis aurantiaca]|uniref:DNA glycosylase n=1 Tax=Hygrophoropsis aurantiaca TaxID=72124 RepID=A0ACB8AH03_9AGAM|nr:DNA glycosylase [Hygrophoropsis aurantiaca]